MVDVLGWDGKGQDVQLHSVEASDVIAAFHQKFIRGCQKDAARWIQAKVFYV